jgi:hypothetical protein
VGWRRRWCETVVPWLLYKSVFFFVCIFLRVPCGEWRMWLVIGWHCMARSGGLVYWSLSYMGVFQWVRDADIPISFVFLAFRLCIAIARLCRMRLMSCTRVD